MYYVAEFGLTLRVHAGPLRRKASDRRKCVASIKTTVPHSADPAPSPRRVMSITWLCAPCKKSSPKWCGSLARVPGRC